MILWNSVNWICNLYVCVYLCVDFLLLKEKVVDKERRVLIFLDFFRIICPQLSPEFQMLPRVLLSLTGSALLYIRAITSLLKGCGICFPLWLPSHAPSFLTLAFHSLQCRTAPQIWMSTAWTGIWPKFIFYKWLEFIWKYWNNTINTLFLNFEGR